MNLSSTRSATSSGTSRRAIASESCDRLRGAPVISLAILTIGVDLIIFTELTRRIGSDILNLGHPWGGNVLKLGGVGLTENRALAILVAGVLISAFFVTFKYSSWGISMRAAAEDGEAAALMGIRMGRVSMVAWMVAGHHPDRAVTATAPTTS